MYYVAVDIGCIECGEDSTVLGIFDGRADAEEVVAKAKELQRANWNGQHYFDVFEVPDMNKAHIPAYVGR